MRQNIKIYLKIGQFDKIFEYKALLEIIRHKFEFQIESNYEFMLNSIRLEIEFPIGISIICTCITKVQAQQNLQKAI